MVVNDLGGEEEGRQASEEPARAVAEAIRAAGGEAVADSEDAGDWEGAGRLVARALSCFGRLDGLVNSAGTLRQKGILSLEPADIDDLLRAQLTGQAALAVHAARHWHRSAEKEGPRDWRIVNTIPPLAPSGRVALTTHLVARKTIAALTLAESEELYRYGVTVNAIAPAARRSARPPGEVPAGGDDGFDPLEVANASLLVAWLCSAGSRKVTGRLFELEGGRLGLLSGWHRVAAFDDEGGLLEEELGAVIDALIEKAPAREHLPTPPSEAPLEADS